MSIIIAAHNEEKNLQELIPSLMNQSYNGFYEIIIVLDRCKDKSYSVVKRMSEMGTKNEQSFSIRSIEITSVPPGWSPKKWAIHRGIQVASYEYLAFTDADCRVSSNWLLEISHHFSGKKEVILGLGKYLAYPEWINLFIRYETFYTAFQYVGWASIGIPYMAVGRNLAYTKAFYENCGGMETIKHRLSGDDDLLINKCAIPAKTQSMISSDSATFSEPKHTFSEWFTQKARHVSASNDYSLITKMTLSSFHLSHTLFYLGILVCLGMGVTLWVVIVLYVIRTVAGIIIFNRINRTIQEPKIISWFPLLDLLMFVYNLTIVPVGLIRTPAWKK